MEFKALKNIESSFRQIRLYAIIFLGCCMLLTVLVVWRCYSFAEAQQDLQQNRPVEAREHVRRFHLLFFDLSPDKSAIEGNLTKALLLADKSAMSYYRDLMEKGYFNRLIAGNIIQKVEVDSIRCDFTNYPYQVKTYARQRILRESSVTERSLVTTCQLVNATRSDNNLQGFLIERFNIIENKDLGTYDR